MEKWGPGPEGPGTVCDRYAARFARYFIFFANLTSLPPALKRQVPQENEASRASWHT